jgi:hypothetical protein
MPDQENASQEPGESLIEGPACIKKAQVKLHEVLEGERSHVEIAVDNNKIHSFIIPALAKSPAHQAKRNHLLEELITACSQAASVYVRAKKTFRQKSIAGETRDISIYDGKIIVENEESSSEYYFHTDYDRLFKNSRLRRLS